MSANPITTFIKHHYRHFNAAAMLDASEAYRKHVEGGGHMLLALAGAMSTAELGLSLAEMIRQDKVHAITCTGANLEEDLFNLVARSQYERIPNYRELTPEAEEDLLRRHLNRVTDTCIPEEYAIRKIEKILIEEWVVAEKKKQHLFPHEFLFKILRECRLKKFYEIDPNDSWMMAAAQKTLPIFVPGWEDSTLGNIYAARNITGELGDVHTVRITPKASPAANYAFDVTPRQLVSALITEHGVFRPLRGANEFVAGSRTHFSQQSSSSRDITSKIKPGAVAGISHVHDSARIFAAQFDDGARQVNGIRGRASLVGDYVEGGPSGRQFQNRVGKALAAHPVKPGGPGNTNLR